MTFEEKMDELKKMHDENPRLVEKELYRFLNELQILSRPQKTLIEDLGIPGVLVGILLLFILLVGLLGKNVFSLYLFGFIFFVAGFFVCVGNKGMGIIFLFSHGGSGAAIMIASLLGLMEGTPIMSDLPNSGYFCLGVALFLIVVATVMTILYNLNDALKEKKYYLVSIVFLYFLGFLVVGLLPYLIKFI